MLKKMMFKKWVIIIGILSGLPCLPAWSYPYSEIYVFGDSLSDTGRLHAATGLLPEGFYYQGRSSNGPLWIEYLATQLNFQENTYNPATNFAWASASSDEIVFWSEEGLGLQLQIDAYLKNYPTADPDGLYFVWAGNNDFLGTSDQQQTLTTTISNLVTAVNKLKTHGAQHIVVLGLPDLGKVPRNVNGDNAILMSQFSRLFNESLATALEPLNVIYIDMQTAFDIVSDPRTIMPASMKLSNFTQACFDQETLAICSEPAHYFFWDELHPTTIGHQLIALFVYGGIANAVYLTAPTIVPHPQPIVTLPLIEVSGDNGHLLLFQGLMSHDPTYSPLEFNLLHIHLQTAHFSLEALYPSQMNNQMNNHPQFEVATGKLYLPVVQMAKYQQMDNMPLAVSWSEKYQATLQWQTKTIEPFQMPYFNLEEIVPLEN